MVPSHKGDILAPLKSLQHLAKGSRNVTGAVQAQIIN